MLQNNNLQNHKFSYLKLHGIMDTNCICQLLVYCSIAKKIGNFSVIPTEFW